jgi:hypothetical protein
MAAVPIVSFQGQIERLDRGVLTSETAIAGMCAAATQSHVPRSPPSLGLQLVSQSISRTPPAPYSACTKSGCRPCGVKSEPVKTPVSAPRHVLLQQCFADHRNNGTKERHVVPCHVKVHPERRQRGRLGVQALRALPCAAMILSGETPLLRALRRGSLGACMC